VTSSSARRLIAAYAGVTALLNLSIWLPGNPEYSSVRAFIGSVAVQALVIWRLWHGSSIAWLIAVTFAVLAVVSLFVIGAEAEVGIILLAVFCIAQAGILATRPVMAFVWSRRQTPAASS
jgi:hypothetical protein